MFSCVLPNTLLIYSLSNWFHLAITLCITRMYWIYWIILWNCRPVTNIFHKFHDQHNRHTEQQMNVIFLKLRTCDFNKKWPCQIRKKSKTFFTFFHFIFWGLGVLILENIWQCNKNYSSDWWERRVTLLLGYWKFSS